MTIHFFTGCTFTLTELMLMFFVYAFLGWCTEVAFAALKSGQFVNRGFLNSPLCPIYGFGIIAVVVLLYPFAEHPFLLLIGSIVITSLLELITGWAMEKLFNTRWWDYSQEPFNLHGYICLRFSILWGLACLGIVQIFHPLIMRLIRWVPDGIGAVVCVVLTVTTVIDLIATVSAVRGLQKRLKVITALAGDIHEVSDSIGEDIYGTVNSILVSTEDDRLRVEAYLSLCADNRKAEKELAQQHRQQEQLLRAELLDQSKTARSEAMEEKRAALQEKLRQRKPAHERILKAFPNMQTKSDTQALEQLRSTLGDYRKK